MHWSELEQLGEADVQIGDLSLWVHGRQLPAATDYWDGNWLRVTASCSSPYAMVCTDGPIVHLGELVGLLQGLRKLNDILEGEAALHCIEPNLRAALAVQWNGAVKVSVAITADQMTERHSFDSWLDQTHLPNIIAQCEAVLAAYPVREPEKLLSHNVA